MKYFFICILCTISFLVGILIYFYSCHSATKRNETNDNSDLIRNLIWYDFGEGIISSSDCRAILIEDAGSHSTITIRDEVTIAKIKQWILKKHLMQGYDHGCSPAHPKEAKLNDQIDISLYATDNVNDSSSLLISIPLTPLTTNTYGDASKYRDTYNEFKGMVGLK